VGWNVRIVDLVASVALGTTVVTGGLVTLEAWAALPPTPQPVAADVTEPAPEGETAPPYHPQPAPSGSRASAAGTTAGSGRVVAARHPSSEAQSVRPDAPEAPDAPDAPDAAAPPVARQPLNTASRQQEPSPAEPPADPAPEPQPTPPTSATVDVRVGSFNVLGSNHTGRGGNKRGWATGVQRTPGAAALIRSHGLDIVGLQELRPDQQNRLTGLLDGYDVYPGSRVPPRESANSIIWRTDVWQLAEATTVPIPYFHGRTIRMPSIRLRHVATGAELWVANFHNPASTKRKGNHERWRDEATRRQVALANDLRARTGLPVVFTGDFNERDEFFCQLVAHTELEASDGGSAVPGRCSPPRDRGIDWVFGTPDITWTSSVRDRSPIARRVSDHPIVAAKGVLRTAG
jgi:endonuclease/exonuclease/phosphatase family metal-dependent hydrolase